MNEQRLGGIALLLALVCVSITLALHPTGHDFAGAGRAAASHVNVFAHSLALVSLPLSAFGLLVLTRELTSPSRLSTAAFVVHAQALVAVMIGAVASGFVATDLFDSEQTSSPELASALLAYTHHLNQAFVRVYAVASSAAVALWSIAALRAPRFGRAFSTWGLAASALGVLGVALGHLHLDLHGLGVIVLSQGVWTCWAAVKLIRVHRDEGVESARRP